MIEIIATKYTKVKLGQESIPKEIPIHGKSGMINIKNLSAIGQVKHLKNMPKTAQKEFNKTGKTIYTITEKTIVTVSSRV
ncbi:hypothetical protein [Flavobacterium cerinum]|uniref:Uncharacterized protein n=1 Tax=Flavobacterium cerinum TaxID=2502784 RepID=A0A444HC17_9FLAO|nr:hypothetical protein [Flavobacterium cerinum]RWX00985.1 hypothetical protein EPI11_08160 [Flavobacterium cerinum]